MCLLAICISSLEKCLFRSLPIFSIRLLAFLLLSCINCLHNLEIKPLSVASLETIFSHSVSCLFILSIVSFAGKKVLSIIRSHLFIFAFISFALGDRSKTILLQFVSKILCCLLGLLWFQVLHSEIYAILNLLLYVV
uniref:Uncharacterized protein n=1 Tax=Sus scrofa TaxID=9823 RepID=A0A8W4F9I8_PIG